MARHSRIAGAILLAALLGQGLPAEIISSALLALPAQTESFEYDNLVQLRRLPNYPELRERFSGKSLDEAKLALAKLDIGEDQAHEMVMAIRPGALYGLVAGTFTASQAMKAAAKHGMSTHLVEGERVICPLSSTCVVFLENSLAAFGTFPELKMILQTRLGLLPRLASNRGVVDLLDGTDQRAPVRGFVYGSELNDVIADALRDESGLHLDWKQFTSNMRALAYSVSMDRRAHVTARLRCQSTMTAAVLRQMLGALSGVQALSTRVGRNEADAPFQNLHVTSSGELVDLSMDTPLPESETHSVNSSGKHPE